MLLLSWTAMVGGVEKKKSRNFGHLKGVDTVKKIVNSSIKLKIPIVTFTCFHLKTGKDQNEISFLFKLIKSYFTKEIGNTISQGIKINIFGEISKLSKDLRSILKRSVKLTKKIKRLL